MFPFVLRRALHAVIVLLVVGIVAVSMFVFVGDPIDNLLGLERTQADVGQLREQLGLDQPIPAQYFKFLSNATEGNFGMSFR